MPTFSIASLKINELSFSLCLIAKVRLEGRAAPQDSFISIQRVDSNPIGSTNLFIINYLQHTYRY